MSTEPVISVDITIDNTSVPRQGFGVPLIASHTATWPERTRSYGSVLEAADDWAADSPELLLISAIYSQENPPEVVKVGRIDSDVTQQYKLQVTSAIASKVYTVDVAGTDMDDETVSAIAESSTLVAAKHSALVTALNAKTDKTYTAAFAALTVADFVFTTTHATETLTKVAHGLNTGDGPVQLTNAGGALPAGLAVLTNYYVIKTDADNFKLAATLAGAFAGTVVAFSDDGTGVHTLDVIAGSKSPTLAFTVTADTANKWFSLSVPMKDANFFAASQVHDDGTLATDLAAILDEDDEWYCLLTMFNSKAYVEAAAAWVEANARIYAVAFSDTECLTTAFDIEAVSATDLMGALCALGYKRTMYSYHHAPNQFFADAWMGNWLPTDPGEATAALKTLVGMTTSKLTSTHFGNLIARRGNAYIFRGGRGITWESTVGNTQYAYLDVTRNIDWLKDGISAAGFGTLAGAPIVPYTRAGMAQLAGAVKGFLDGEGLDSGVLDRELPPVVTPPKFETIPVQNKKERKLRTLKWRGRLSGAIHSAEIDGTVSF